MPSTSDSSPSGVSQPRSRGRAWGVVVAAALVGLALWSWRGRVPGPGSTIAASISLVTSDQEDLACASDRSFGRYRCEFRAPGERWPAPPAPAEQMAAYYTTEQRLFVIPGLFQQPAVAARYAAEAPRNLPRDQRPRFSVHCRLKLVQQLYNFQARWLARGDWGPEDHAWVAVASDCSIP